MNELEFAFLIKSMFLENI